MKCYLVARFDATVDPPVLLAVGTYGESWGTLTLAHSRKQFYADLAEGEGKTYDDAMKSLMKVIDYYPGLHWVRGWLDGKRTAVSSA